MIIRPERQGDESQIRSVTELAFRNMPFSDQTEHLVIERLRRAGALSISLVAEDGPHIIGHIGFSPVSINDDHSGWYGLGPVSVLPEHQRAGVGSALINEGLSILKSRQACGCVVAGDPAYYQRFGFHHDEGLIAEGVPGQYFTILRLQHGTSSGIVRYHHAFFGDTE